jgi:uncharacterized protein (TIGR00730 family)
MTAPDTAPHPAGPDRLTEQFDQIIHEAGGDATTFEGALAREIMHTAVKLIRDGADAGELKLISRSVKELRYALKVFRDYRQFRKISIFGSARTPEDHPDFLAAADFGRAISSEGWMVITGAGGGIMHAGHGGAGVARSFGVAIRLPFETSANEVIAGDPKLVTFRYFFARKLMFVSQAHAVALFPGGFGTLDECYEVLTLIQTGKAPLVPLVMVDPPGGRYWREWDRYVQQHLLVTGMISPADQGLYFITDDTAAAVAHVLAFYRVYHSQRFVRDELVLRLNKPLTQRQIDALNDEFSDLCADGCMMQSKALEGEQELLDLPRLHFIFARRDYGRLRQLIDAINATWSVR